MGRVQQVKNPILQPCDRPATEGLLRIQTFLDPKTCLWAYIPGIEAVASISFLFLVKPLITKPKFYLGLSGPVIEETLADLFVWAYMEGPLVQLYLCQCVR